MPVTDKKSNEYRKKFGRKLRKYSDYIKTSTFNTNYPQETITVVSSEITNAYAILNDNNNELSSDYEISTLIEAYRKFNKDFDDFEFAYRKGSSQISEENFIKTSRELHNCIVETWCGAKTIFESLSPGIKRETEETEKGIKILSETVQKRSEETEKGIKVLSETV